MKKLFTLITLALIAVGGAKAEEQVLFEGSMAIDWDGNQTWGTDGGDELTNVGAKAGDKLKFKFDATADSWQVKIVEGHWAHVDPNDQTSDNVTFAYFKSWENPLDADGYATVEITEEMLTYATNKQYWGAIFRFQGEGATLTKIVFEPAVNYYSTTLWEGECDFGTGWSSGFKIASDKFSNVVEGDILEFVYTTSSSATYWQFSTQFADTDEKLTSNSSDLNSYGCASVNSGSTKYRITLNASDIAKLKVNGLYTCGYACVVTKVNLLSLTEKTPDSTKQLSLTTLDGGWDAEYNADTKTITITGDNGGGKGWWLVSNEIPTDYSQFDNLVIEFDPATTTSGWVTVEYAVEGVDASYIEFNPGATCVVVPLDATNKNQVKQIYISGAKGNTYTLKAAYLAVASATPAAQLGTPIWTVAGDENIFGSNWSTTDTANDMISTDGTTYTLVKENLTLESDVTYKFKVVKNHAWDTSYPASDYELKVTETAVYTLTVTFNSSTNEVSATPTKTGEAATVTHTYRVIGTLVGGWENENEVDMTETEAGSKIYTATIKNVEASETAYEYKVRADHAWTIQWPNSTANYSVTVSQTSDVTITLNLNTNEVSHSITTGISTINAAKQQNAVRYNLAGQKVDESYKGVVIENGKKFVVK